MVVLFGQFVFPEFLVQGSGLDVATEAVALSMVEAVTMWALSLLQVFRESASAWANIFFIDFGWFEVLGVGVLLVEPFGVVNCSCSMPRVRFGVPSRNFREFDPFKGVNGGLIFLFQTFFLPPGIREFFIKVRPVIMIFKLIDFEVSLVFPGNILGA